MLAAIGLTTAVKLCQSLECAGYDKKGAQLGIQRAIDAGNVIVNRDLSLRASSGPNYAASASPLPPELKRTGSGNWQ
jgi:nitrous oxidase accessory protein NosD